jgi:hypothetical protein
MLTLSPISGPATQYDSSIELTQREGRDETQRYKEEQIDKIVQAHEAGGSQFELVER